VKEMATGRPIKLTDGLIEQAADALRRVYYVETVADLLGIHKDTFYDWLKRGETERETVEGSIFTRFSDAVKRARAEAKQELLAKVRAGSGADWQSKAWILERCFPREFGRIDRAQIELTGKDGGDMTIQVSFADQGEEED
jgi:transposase